MNKKLPDEKVIRQYQESIASRFGLDVDFSLWEEDYISANGQKLHLDVLIHRESSPTLVFIPGTATYARAYAEFMSEVHKRGFNVVGFDPRGHGRSSGLRGDYTINEIVDDTLAVVEYARQRFRGKVAIAGSSQGGIVALYAAARDDSLAGAVCHNLADLNGRDNIELSTVKIPHWLSPPARLLMRIYQGYSIPISIYLDLEKEKLSDGSDAAKHINEDPLCVSWISMRAMRSLLKTDLARPVDEITVPICLVHSAGDNIFPKEYVEGIYASLTCPKEYILLEGKDHLVMTNYVDDIIEPVSGWLRKVTR
jgi:alpha-beta hydrolase superfamily lysophospholipase